MNHRTTRLTSNILVRAQRYAAARRSDDFQLVRAIELEIVEEQGLPDHHRDVELLAARTSGEFDVSPFEATQRFASLMQAEIARFCERKRRPRPLRDLFDLWLATQTQFLRLWYARRTVDGLEVPYADYLQHAVQWWIERGEPRKPTPLQLTSGEAALAVLERWQPLVRANES